MSTVADLAGLLRLRRFRQLYAVRLTSQFGDGVFQVSLAAYVVFSPERQPSAAAMAAALAVVLLPYSLLGPFVGVFLDRWSRRQTLVWCNLIRVGLTVLLAAAMAQGRFGAGLFLVVLVCLSVNRFLLAGLSAALPHVVGDRQLVTANALTPTSGTAAYVVGLGAGAGLRMLWPLSSADAAVLVAAACWYLLAGGLALRIPRRLLGPDGGCDHPSLARQLAGVLRGLRQGVVHLRQRPAAAYALGSIGVHRFFYGVFTVSMVLLYRNYFHGPDELDAAFADLSVAAVVSGAGFVLAAVATPAATRAVGIRTWVVLLLAAGAVTQLVPGALYTPPAVLATAFCLGLVSQGIKVSADTQVQRHVADDFRGRVFSLYDMVFNVSFVAAAAAAAAALPQTGRSYPVLAAIAVGYAAAAVAFHRLSARTEPVAAEVSPVGPSTTTAGLRPPPPR